MRRRDALIIGGAFAAAIALPPLLRRWPGDFAFEPLTGFPGFRKLKAGSISAGSGVFAGLEAPGRAAGKTPVGLPKSPCLELFGPGGWTDGELPIAVFSDYYCPYCTVLERHLITLREKGAAIRLVWHNMPLLGPASVRSAKASLAAKRQSAEDAAHQYLMDTHLRPGPSALRAMAKDLRINPTEFVADAKSPEVAAELERCIQLGTRLGIPGTPGTVVGRTLVIGAIASHDLDRLIRLEASEPFDDCT